MDSKRTVKITCAINGRLVEERIPPNQTLCDFLHDEVGLTSVKKGCDTGECGACTVLLDGKPVASCLVLAPMVDGHSVTTIEDLSNGEGMHPVQEAFVELDAIQCGYCIPGMLLCGYALLREVPEPTESQIKRYLSGNLCRCTGYQQQIEAVKVASKRLAARKASQTNTSRSPTRSFL